MQQQQEEISAEITVDTVMNDLGYDKFVRSLFNRCGTPSVDFTHAVLGVCTEVVELLSATDGVNALEEMGDLEFYLEALTQVLFDTFPNGFHEGITADQVARDLFARYPQISTLPIDRLVQNLSSELLDIAKRWVGYGKSPELAPMVILSLATTIVQSAALMAVGRGQFGSQTVRRANVGKLLKRYKGLKFNAEHAVNRDLGAERKILDAAAAAS